MPLVVVVERICRKSRPVVTAEPFFFLSDDQAEIDFYTIMNARRL